MAEVAVVAKQPQWFIGKPTSNGWYFVSKNTRDWDIAKPVAVRRIEYGNGNVEFEFSFFDDKGWLGVELLENAIWYGPLVINPPPDSLRKIAESTQQGKE